jgi:exodeoxyribonuclease VII large subunit
MASSAEIKISPSECISLLNQSLEYAFHGITVVGEIHGAKLNRGQYIFIDLKDDYSTLNCFTTPYQLSSDSLTMHDIADGTLVEAVVSPKLLNSGRFSFTIIKLKVIGEGGIKNQFDELKLKYQKLGFFEPSRKRQLPSLPTEIAVISSKDAAGWKDFLHILNLNWPAVKINLYNVSVQGAGAPKDVASAIKRANQNQSNQAIVIVRGGGSSDDLATFNSEDVIEQIFSSSLPVLVGVGHKVDVTLSELTADRAAATPTDAANILFQPWQSFIEVLKNQFEESKNSFQLKTQTFIKDLNSNLNITKLKLSSDIDRIKSYLALANKNLELNDINKLFEQGFMLASGDIYKAIQKKELKPGDDLKLRTKNAIIITNVKVIQYE